MTTPKYDPARIRFGPIARNTIPGEITSRRIGLELIHYRPDRPGRIVARLRRDGVTVRVGRHGWALLWSFDTGARRRARVKRAQEFAREQAGKPYVSDLHPPRPLDGWTIDAVRLDGPGASS